MKNVRIFRFDKAGTISRAKDIATTEKLQEAQRYNNWANIITASWRNIIKYFNTPGLAWSPETLYNDRATGSLRNKPRKPAQLSFQELNFHWE